MRPSKKNKFLYTVTLQLLQTESKKFECAKVYVEKTTCWGIDVNIQEMKMALQMCKCKVMTQTCLTLHTSLSINLCVHFEVISMISNLQLADKNTNTGQWVVKPSLCSSLPIWSQQREHSEAPTGRHHSCKASQSPQATMLQHQNVLPPTREPSGPHLQVLIAAGKSRIGESTKRWVESGETLHTTRLLGL